MMVAISTFPAFAADPLPAFTAPVVDEAGVVPDGIEQTIDSELNAYQARSGNQIAVAVVKTTGGRSIEDYGIDLARAWGVGSKDKDNGVLLTIAYNDHRLRIDVGRGLEATLTDLQAGRIIREQITPRLKVEDIGGAIQAGTLAIRQSLGDPQAAQPLPVNGEPGSGGPGGPAPFNPSGGGGGGGGGWGFLPFLLFGAFGLFSLAGGGFGYRRRRRFGWAGPIFWGGGWGGYGGGFGGGFGGSSGGGGGGGFSGGGGGSFGGGGASGSW
jgi:uncharacterized protein